VLPISARFARPASLQSGVVRLPGLATKSKLGHPQKLTTILQSFSAHKEWRHRRRYVRLPSPSRTPTRLDRKSLSNKTKSLSLGRLPHVL
jgi:hypothetical protein